MNVFAGLDIGGTTIKYLLVDENNKILCERRTLTNSLSGIDAMVASIVSTLDEMAKNVKGNLVSVGIGCTGPVDIESGIILNPYTLPGLEGNSLTSLLRKHLSLPICIDNDANCAHLGELLGLNPLPENSIMMTFGTGVGVSIRVGGKLFRIPGNIHPEIGHIGISVKAKDMCYCGKANCLEHILSGTAINKAAKNRFGLSPEDVLSSLDGMAVQVFQEELICALYDAVVTLSIIFAPQVVLLGGGMQTFLFTYIVPQVQEKLDALQTTYGRTVLAKPRHGDTAGCLGATLMAINNYR